MLRVRPPRRRGSARASGTLAIGLLLLAAAVLVAIPARAYAQQGLLDSTQDAYQTTVRAWLGPVSAIAQRLFMVLASIELAVSGLLYVMRRDSLDRMAGRFLLKFIVLSMVLMLITSAGFWLPPIVNGLASAGQAGSGTVAPIGPSGIVDLGLRIAWGMIDTRGLPLSFASLETSLYALTSRLVITLSFVLVAVQVVLAWVEAYVALAGGVLFLGFGGTRVTAQFAENYLGFLFYVGVRLFALYLLLGIGVSILETQLASMPPAITPAQMGELLAVAVIFAVVTTRIPASMASRIAGGGGNFGLAAALRSL